MKKTNKVIAVTLSLMALLGVFSLPLTGNAQYVTSSGYYNPVYPQPSSVGCVSITNYLGYGSSDYNSGGQVSKLQNFLSSRGYMTNTISTGYFGVSTSNALRSFQAANGISSTGLTGPLTRAKIYSLSCGGIVTPPNSQISITSISPTYGAIGSLVTIYGTGFTSNNTIYFGSENLGNVASYDGRTLSFTVPSQFSTCNAYGACLNSIRQVVQGTYQVYVTNSYGTSNTVNFQVSGYPYSGNYGQPVINNLQTPTSLSVGQTGTWTVNATAPDNQSLTYSVNWGDQYGYLTTAGNQIAYNGQTSTFTHSYATAGTYTATFTVTSSSGQTAQTSSTVQVGNSNCYNYNNYNSNYYNNCGTTGSVSINSISPTQVSIGNQVTIYGTGFTSTNNTVKFGQYGIGGISSYDGRTLTFVVPSYAGNYCAPGLNCTAIATQVQNGVYSLSVINTNGTSNSINFTVGYGNNGNNGVTLSSASPSSAAVNTQVTLYGSNFSSNETVHFGSSVINNVYSNGNSLTFYVPSQQLCTYQSSGSYGTNCGVYYQATNPGTYQIYVTDQYGTQQSNTINFVVTGNSSSNISLSSMTSNPSIGSIITVYGTGFDYSNNSVYINDQLAVSNVSSNNSYIQFTLPAAAGGCSTSTGLCSDLFLRSGSTYRLTVRSSSGYASNALQFTVGYEYR